MLFSTGLQGCDVDPFYLNNAAIFVGTPRSQQLVARKGDPAPDGTPGLIYRRSSSGAPFGGLHFNDSGQAAYTALLSGPGINVTNSVGQFAGAPGDVRMLVRSNDPSPIPGMNWGGSFTISVYQGTPGALAHGVPHRRARAADDAGRDFWSTCITAPTWS